MAVKLAAIDASRERSPIPRQMAVNCVQLALSREYGVQRGERALTVLPQETDHTVKLIGETINLRQGCDEAEAGAG